MPLLAAQERVDTALLDREPFQFRHGFMDHPALSLKSLAEVLPALPADQVMYSRKLDDLSSNMDTAHLDYKNGLSIEDTIENIRTSNSYIAVRKPEAHPVFRELTAELTNDIGELMRQRGTGTKPEDMELWLFIASPNAITPFHFDRFSNFLLQVRGGKQLAVFKPWNPEVLEPRAYEAHVARAERRMDWHPDKDRFAMKYQLAPGDGVHIPFLGGHYVQNGPDDASITLSVFFHTDETERWSRALMTNHILRKRLQPFGFAPNPIHTPASPDALKAAAYPLVRNINRAFNLAERGLRYARRLQAGVLPAMAALSSTLDAAALTL